MPEITKAQVRNADVNFDISAVSGNMPCIKDVYVSDTLASAFLEPETHPMLTSKGAASKTPSIFMSGSMNTGIKVDGQRLFESIQTNSFYPYSVFSAIRRVAENEMSKRAGEEKPKKTPEELEENRVLREAKEAWKKASSGGIVNAENPKYYTTEAHLINPSSTYYSGAKGASFGEDAGFNSLHTEELTTIASMCKVLIEGAQNNAKLDNYTCQVKVPTPEGFREMERIKADTRHDEAFRGHKGFYLDDKAYKDKLEWIESFDFQPGWNIPDQEKVEIKDVGKLTSNAISALEVFNIAFCLNAINTAKLFVFIDD